MGIDSLSEREREVFLLAVRGATSAEIAAKLGVSEKTVGTHRARINAKLGVHSPTDLILLAVREGILTRESLGQAR